MKRPIDAVYENGAFRPLEPGGVDIPDGQRVRITIEGEGVRITIEGEAGPEALRLATGVYEGLSEQQIDEIELIALDRSNFFGTTRAD